MARIVVTRPAGREEELVARLRALGHDVTHVPLVATEPLGDGPVDVEGYDWVVLTSVVGARELRRRMRGLPRRVAAIGRATAEAFGGADLVPAVATQEGLLAELPRPAGRVLFAGAADARRLLVDALGAEFLPLYRTRRLLPESFPKDADLVVLASASAAEAYAATGAETPAVSIGPQTTAAARAEGVRILAEAETHDVDGLVEAIRRCSSRS
ncbi:MAG TPA: uroporphyrinogen-III synthase [Gaiellaceae bacterium]|nr:uroporphyrinogen-III synthase [Gaiellaceae bacterium]